MGPAAGVIELSGKIMDTWVVGDVGDKECTDCADEELRGRSVATTGLDRPLLRCFVPMRIRHPSFELNVLFEIVAIGEVFEVGENVGLCRLRLGPLPLVHEFFGKRVRVERAARRIHPRAGVAVVPPGTAYSARAVEGANIESQFVAEMV